MKIAKKIWANEFYKGGIFLTLSSVFVNILNYFFNFIVARSLGPVGFGDISALFSYISIISVPVSLISLVLIQKVSSTKYDKLEYTLTLEDFFWRILCKYWYVALPFIMIIPFIPRLTNLSFYASLFLMPYIFVSLIGSFYSSSLQGLRFFFIASLLSAMGAVLKLTGGVISLFFPFNLILVLSFLLVSIIVPQIITRFILYKETKKRKKVTKGTITKSLPVIIKSSHVAITLFSVLGLTLFNNLDIVFVKKFFTAYESGIYSSWAILAKVILYIVSPISAVSYVFFASSTNTSRQNKNLILSLLVLLSVGLISFVGYKVVGSSLLEVVFGPKFNPIRPFLGEASIYGSLYAAIAFINNYFLAKKSKYALILPIFMPFYFLALYIFRQKLDFIFLVNIGFGVFITLIYLGAWAKTSYKQTSFKLKQKSS